MSLMIIKKLSSVSDLERQQNLHMAPCVLITVVTNLLLQGAPDQAQSGSF